MPRQDELERKVVGLNPGTAKKKFPLKFSFDELAHEDFSGHCEVVKMN